MTDASAARWTFKESGDITKEELAGYRVEATDGHIGDVDDASAEAGAAWLVVDTGFWIFGRQRLIPAGAITRVDRESRTVWVDMTKDEIKDAPDFDTAWFGDDTWRTSYDYYDPYMTGR